METVPLGGAEKHPESWYRDLLAAQIGGETEARLPFGWADVMTETTVFEVEPATTWRAGVRQVLAYAAQCSKRGAIALYGKPSKVLDIWEALQQLPAPGIDMWWLADSEFVHVAGAGQAATLTGPVTESRCGGRRRDGGIVFAVPTEADLAAGLLVVPQIVALSGRTEATVRVWMASPGWPAPAEKRGKWHLYPAAQVAEAVRWRTKRDVDPTDQPDQLLTTIEAAEYAGISQVTVRSDMSRGRWPEPDDEGLGVKRWKRSTIDQVMSSRRPYRRRAVAG